MKMTQSNGDNSSNYYIYDLEDDDDFESSIYKRRRENQLWDSFQDPPSEHQSESSKDSKCITFSIKLLKIFTYIFVFIMIFVSGILSKISFIFMTSHIGDEATVRYCDVTIKDKELTAHIPIEQKIAWKWAILFAFAVPELGTLIRSLRICLFKNINCCTWKQFLFVWCVETLHVCGLGILAFKILPELDAIKAVMLTNNLCFVPTILNLLSRSPNESRRGIKYILDAISIAFQFTGFIIWPLISKDKELYFIPIATILISLHWWENYVSQISPIKSIQHLARMREFLTESRYRMHMYIAPWKILVFFATCVAFANHSFTDFFTKYRTGFGSHSIRIEEVQPIFGDNLPDFSDLNSEFLKTTRQSTANSIYWILLVQIISSYFCYIFSKFACKIQIQIFSFSFPISLTVPVSVTLLMLFCGLREVNPCAFHKMLPDYMFFQMPPIYFMSDYVIKDVIWIWLLWLFSQTWVTKHLWNPKSDKNASTEMLFVSPMYNSLIIDQDLALNRRRDDCEDFVKKMDQSLMKNPEILNEIDEKVLKKIEKELKPQDRIPQVYVCATMWHETIEEMMEFLKSIIRLDEDQCSRRMARKYIQLNKDEIDSEYYDLESHIFFDDAFVTNKDLCETPDSAPINNYVRLLVTAIEKAAREVYKVRMKIQAPIKIETPYGGRLIWILPGRTKLIAHLKNKNKIRHKKRWSQVMYMYYLLGYRIMQVDTSPERKKIIAQNTFLLALDGDIDFQPKALHLLIGRMKVDPDLGAACGRIHPVGKGPMVWYQIFEYAIGHWLQKATEHVIGCVLCSPGCFSLFRGLALMEHRVMKKYTTKSESARHYVQYDQGEDRWLCTLLLKQRFRVEYSAASDAYTHCPEGFNEFYNQRRRWVPSTLANIFDLLEDAKSIVKNNNSFSTPYVLYQSMIMCGTIIGPGTIFLMMVGSIAAVFQVDVYTAFLWEFIPLMIFMLMCYFSKQKYQLVAAFVTSIIYALIMMAVLIGVIMQMLEDGPLAPASLFFLLIVLQISVCALLHPQEMYALFFGGVYYITIPSMYLLLTIYSLFNLNDVSWGTRENPQAGVSEKKVRTKRTRLQKIFGYLQPDKEEEEGGLECSIAGLFNCMLCTHKKPNNSESQLLHIGASLSELNSKLKNLEMKMTQSVTVMQSDNEHELDTEDETDGLIDVPLLKDNESPKSNLLPHWLNDEDLAEGEMETLPVPEEQFWVDLIEKYLKPLEINEYQKEHMANQLRTLRDISVFAFVMCNALFVLIIFLLQLNKDRIHVVWPLDPKDTILFDSHNFEISIEREYLELDPLGLVLVVFFGLVLVIQFIAMLFHRFETISELLATTDIDWYCNRKIKETVVSSEIKENAVEIARKLQKPKTDWDPEDYEELPKLRGRHDTIQQLLLHHSKREDWSNLEVNFKRELFKDGDLNLGRMTVSRKAINTLNEKRRKMIRKRKMLDRTSDFSISPYFTSPESQYSNPNNWGDNEYTYISQRAPIKPPSMISLDTNSTNTPRVSRFIKERTPKVNVPDNDFGYDNPSFLDDSGKVNVQIEMRGVEVEEEEKDVKLQQSTII